MEAMPSYCRSLPTLGGDRDSDWCLVPAAPQLDLRTESRLVRVSSDLLAVSAPGSDRCGSVCDSLSRV